MQLIRKPPILWTWLTLLFKPGVGNKELLELEWERVDWKNNEIILEAKYTKFAKPRKVPINPPAQSALIR